MKKLALTLSLVFACSSFAFAMDNLDLDGSLDKSKATNSRIEGDSLLADVSDGVTFQVDKNTHKIQSVRYTKRGAKYRYITIGDYWDFHLPSGHSDFSYSRGDDRFHFYTEKDGTSTVYETADSRVVAITRIAKSYTATAKKYHNMRQLGLIK